MKTKSGMILFYKIGFEFIYQDAKIYYGSKN